MKCKGRANHLSFQQRKIRHLREMMSWILPTDESLMQVSIASYSGWEMFYRQLEGRGALRRFTEQSWGQCSGWETALLLLKTYARLWYSEGTWDKLEGSDLTWAELAGMAERRQEAWHSYDQDPICKSDQLLWGLCCYDQSKLLWVS